MNLMSGVLVAVDPVTPSSRTAELESRLSKSPVPVLFSIEVFYITSVTLCGLTGSHFCSVVQIDGREPGQFGTECVVWLHRKMAFEIFILWCFCSYYVLHVFPPHFHRWACVFTCLYMAMWASFSFGSSAFFFPAVYLSHMSRSRVYYKSYWYYIFMTKSKGDLVYIYFGSILEVRCESFLGSIKLVITEHFRREENRARTV